MRRAFIAFMLALLLVGAGIAVARATSHSIDGIGCDPGEGAGYHIHAYLTIVVRGHRHHPPAGVGIHPEHLCLYWLHTHDNSGIIHVEAPRTVHTSLGQFFAVWGQPLSRTRVAQFSVRSGKTMRVFVDRHLYSGNPAAIPIRSHRSITIEIGPPFVPPVLGSFIGL